MCAMAQPQWTKREERRGVDPLGMQSTSVSLYQRLVPGISNVTLRMRYYGLYAWLADQYAKTDGNTSVEGWRKYIRRSEALYALIVRSSTQENGVAGTRWAKRKLDAVRGPWVTFAEHADDAESTEPQYLKQSFGAYGAAYGTQLFEMGILSEAEKHDVPVPSAQIGDALAAVFSAAIGEAGGVFLAAVARGSITKGALQGLAAMVPSAIAPDGPERAAYEKLLLARSVRQSAGDLKRRLTVQLILQVAKGLKRRPSVVDIRWALYALHDDQGRKLAPLSGEMAAQRYAWVVYQANDLCHACYEGLLKYSLDVLEGYAGGVLLDAWLDLVIARVVKALGTKAARSWDGLVQRMSLLDDSWADEGDSEFSLIAQVLEGAGTSSATNAEGAAAALRLLAVLYKRFSAQLDEIEEELKPVSESPYVHSLATEIRFIAAKADEPLERTLRSVLKMRIIDRHLWVAIQKLHLQGDYTFLVETDNGRIRLRRKDGPVLTNPRLGTSLTFLRDIHLIGPEGLTKHGRRVAEGG